MLRWVYLSETVKRKRLVEWTKQDKIFYRNVSSTMSSLYCTSKIGFRNA